MTQTEPAYTPGPWSISTIGRGFYISPARRAGEIAALIPFVGVSDAQRDANARLIAAAPRLAKALEGLLERYADWPDAGVSPRVLEARAALAEALGTTGEGT